MIVDHRDVRGAFGRLAIPIGLSMVGDQLLSVVDTIVIGSLGTVALAGATGAFALFVTLVFALFGFASGISIVAAQRVGAGDVDGLGRTARAGAIAPLILATLFIIAAFLLAKPVLGLMVGPIASLDASAAYLVLRCLSLIPISISLSIISALGAAGNRRPQVIALILINAVHVPLVFMLALGWLTHRPFGIEGAGVSSLVSEIIAAVYLIAYAVRHSEYRMLTNLSIDWPLALQTARLSLPEVVFLVAVLAPDNFIIAMLAPLGAGTISAFRALTVVSDFTFIVPIPLQEATQTVIGQRLGAHDAAGAQEFFTRAMRFALIFTGLTGIIVAALAWPLAFVFTLNAAVASVAAAPLALHMVTLPLKGYAMTGLAPLRAAGDTRFSMFAGLLSSLLVLPIAWVAIKVLGIGLYAVPIAWIIAWLARAFLTFVRLRRKDWMSYGGMLSTRSI
jgi:putative MATE family efflux protein